MIAEIVLWLYGRVYIRCIHVRQESLYKIDAKKLNISLRKRKSGDTGTGLPLLYAGTKSGHCSICGARRRFSRRIRKSGDFTQCLKDKRILG